VTTTDRSRVTVEQLLTELNDAAAQSRKTVAERRARGDVITLPDCWFATWEELRNRLRADVEVEYDADGTLICNRQRYVTKWTMLDA